MSGAAEAARALLWEEREATLRDAPARYAMGVLLEVLLGHTHDFYRAKVTRHFQHLVIGSREVTETCRIAPGFESSGCLRRYDRPPLSAESQAHVRGSVAGGRVRQRGYPRRAGIARLAPRQPGTKEIWLKLTACSANGRGEVPGR